MNIKIIEVDHKAVKMLSSGRPVLDKGGKKVLIDKMGVLKADIDLIKERGYDHFINCHKHINYFIDENKQVSKDMKALWRLITGEAVPQKAKPVK